jgi:hypothetical protein
VGWVVGLLPSLWRGHRRTGTFDLFARPIVVKKPFAWKLFAARGRTGSGDVTIARQCREGILPTQDRALNPRTVAADVRRRNVLIRHALRLLTSAATQGRFMGRGDCFRNQTGLSVSRAFATRRSRLCAGRARVAQRIVVSVWQSHSWTKRMVIC